MEDFLEKPMGDMLEFSTLDEIKRYLSSRGAENPPDQNARLKMMKFLEEKKCSLGDISGLKKIVIELNEKLVVRDAKFLEWQKLFNNLGLLYQRIDYKVSFTEGYQ